jgi:hypothetical protein
MNKVDLREKYAQEIYHKSYDECCERRRVAINTRIDLEAVEAKK